MDERLTADELADSQLDLSLESARLYAEYRRLADEQAARITGFAELIGTTMVAGHRDEQKRQMLDDTSQRSLDRLAA